MAQLVKSRRDSEPTPPPRRIVIRPKPLDGQAEFSVAREGDLWRVRGDKPERWIQQTDFTNAEAVGYLADRLNRIGIEDRLLELGAQPGDGVAIGGANAVIFDFAPQIEIGSEILSRRGEDGRLTEERPAAQRRHERNRIYHAEEEVSEDLPPEADENLGAGPSTTSGHDDA
jgi:GTP-binding protein